MSNLLIAGQHRTAETKLVPLDTEQLGSMVKRQIVIRPDHKGVAELSVDPERAGMSIGGSVLTFNPESQQDEAVGLKLVSVSTDGARAGLDLEQFAEGLTLHLDEGQQFGMYLFTPTPSSMRTERMGGIYMDCGRMVQVQGNRTRSLICAVRMGERPIAQDQKGEVLVPLMRKPKGFPRAYLQTSKTQRPGIMVPGVGGYEQRVIDESEPLVFGENVSDGTALTVAMLEWVEHHELRTTPVDVRANMSLLLASTMNLDLVPQLEPAELASLHAPQRRLLGGMRVVLRKKPAVPDGTPLNA